jgi:APA family basic amino acid/polyamine antiporter
MVGIIIGSGIFRSPAAIAKQMGNPGLILLLWGVGGALSLFGALTYAELGTMFPRSGGIYVYLKEGLGRTVAFVFGWTYLLVGKPLAAGGITIFLAENVNKLLGIGPDPAIVACLILLALTGVNTLGTRLGAAVALVLTGLKVIALLAIVAAGAFAGSESGSAPEAGASSLGAVAPVMYLILFAYDGWSDVASVAGEVKDPRRLLPRILLLGTGFTVALYLAANVVYFGMVPMAEMRSADNLAPLVMQRLLGAWAGVAVTAMIVASTLGTSHGSIITGARVTFAQARDGLLFRFLGHVHPRFETPDWSLWFQVALSCAAVLFFKKFERLAENYSFTMWIFYALAAASVIVLRVRRPDLERPYRCWGYPWVPVLFIAAAVTMTVLSLLPSGDRGVKLAALGILVSGLPAFWVWRWAAKPRVESPE